MNRKSFLLSLPLIGFLPKIFAKEKSLPELMNEAHGKIGDQPDHIITTPEIYNMYKYGIFDNVTFQNGIQINDVCAFNFNTNKARKIKKALRKNETVAVRLDEKRVQTRGLVSANIGENAFWKEVNGNPSVMNEVSTVKINRDADYSWWKSGVK